MADRALVEALMAPGVAPPDLAALIAPRPPWMADAACREHPDVPFVPERGQASAPAKTICAGCLVTAECLAFALADPELVGVWGGTSNRERCRPVTG